MPLTDKRNTVGDIKVHHKHITNTPKVNQTPPTSPQKPENTDLNLYEMLVREEQK